MPSMFAIKFKTLNKTKIHKTILADIIRIEEEYNFIGLHNENLSVYFSPEKVDISEIIARLKRFPGYQTIIQNIYFHDTLKKTQ